MKEEKNKILIPGKKLILEALNSDMPIEKIFFIKGETPGEIISLAKKKSIEIVSLERDKFLRLIPAERSCTAAAFLSEFIYSDIEDIFSFALNRGEDPLIALLDGIEDTHNLGAIIRSAHQAGAHGVIIREKRGASISSSVIRASAGAVFYIPIVRVTNISKSIECLKKKGVWVAAADMDGTSIYKANLLGPLAIVIGNESKGVSPLVKKHSDFTVSVPMFGRLDSLNAAVAFSLIVYEAKRRRLYYVRDSRIYRKR